jgi:glutamate decarboxylase
MCLSNPTCATTARDFRVPEVLSISASGHKFGQSCCGTGWIVWRRRRGLAEHVAVSVSYLGGVSDSYTLNFSRPAAGVYCQMYKFLRLGGGGCTS